MFTSTATEAEDYYNLPRSCYTHVTTVSCTNSMPREAYKRSWELFWGLTLLNTKRRPLYIKTQFVPRSKHFSSRL